MIGRRSLFSWLKCTSLVLLALVMGCLDKIDIEAPRNVQDGIVVTAKLVAGNTPYLSVELNRVFDFTGQSLQSVGAREVVLLNDQGETIVVPESRPGQHQLFIDQTAQFTVEDGMSFQLSITTFDGRELISRPDRLMPVPTINGISVRQTMKDGVNGLGDNVRLPFLDFSVETPILSDGQQEKARLKWDFRRTYAVTDEDIVGNEGRLCYLSEVPDPTRLVVQDGNLFDKDVITTSVYDELINPRFAEGYYLTVIQQSLSSDAFEYWAAVAQSIERTGNLFEPPAGRIRTNFEIQSGSEDSDIFGFFYVTNETSSHFYVSPETAGNPTTFCPPPPTPGAPGGGCAVPVCCNCLSVPGSTTSKPFFWTE